MANTPTPTPETNDSKPPNPQTITPLLRSLRPTTVSEPSTVDLDAIAAALSSIFTNTLTPTHTALLLYTLSLTGLEQRPDVLARCASVMRDAAVSLDTHALKTTRNKKRAERKIGGYNGGLCDIVGTGGDFHSTFNISTASSIICSSLLLIAKHGNRASTSKSGSADVLGALVLPAPSVSTVPIASSTALSAAGTSGEKQRKEGLSPKLEKVTPETLMEIYERTNYAFLYAPNFHTGLRHVAPLRKELPCPTIFNLLGPLTNPAEAGLEARVIGVKRRDLVGIFAEALRIMGVRKGMVVCGVEDLDEVSCAGVTQCARLVVRRNRKEVEEEKGKGSEEGKNEDADGVGDVKDVSIERFAITPDTFGLPRHELDGVSPGLTPEENAAILMRLLRGELGDDHPILHFVLMNAATLFVVSGVCEGEVCPFGSGEEVIRDTGPGGARWKEGVRLARLAIRTGRSLEMLRGFAEVTCGF